MEGQPFQEETRRQTSLLAPVEKRILLWLARHMPSWVGPDHLTALGFAALLLAGISYSLSRGDARWLHLVNAALALNWFGDSLDGTIARFRRRERPRYGFYVDHIIDAFGTVFVLGGLGLSGYMSERVALWLCIVYFMLCINVYLATHSLGTFRISFWKLSPTELRLLLGIGNLVLLAGPRVGILGRSYLLFDVGGMVGIVGMVLMLVTSAIRTVVVLHRAERL